jgi:hypothetical protein
MRKFAALLLVITGAVAIWWFDIGRYSKNERILFGRIDNIIAFATPSAAKIVDEFELPRECETKTCYFGASKSGSLSHGGGRLTKSDDGIVFELNGFNAECIRTKSAVSRFGGQIVQACSDAQCWYLQHRHDWGLLAFGLEKPKSVCISSIVINTLP